MTWGQLLQVSIAASVIGYHKDSGQRQSASHNSALKLTAVSLRTNGMTIKMDSQDSTEVVMCAGGIVLDRQGRILLVRRLHEPEAGLWSVPGGKSKPGETPEQTALREIREETGLVVTVERLLGRTRRDSSRPGVSYDIHDFLCRPLATDAQRGDDAAEIGWYTQTELEQLPLTQDLLPILEGWRVFEAEQSTSLDI